MIVDGNKLIADEGKSLTNGAIYSKLVWLGIHDSVENWQEIPDEEIPAEQEDATEQDYQAALNDLGVSV